MFYGAFEVLVGIGTGIPVDDVNGLAASDRAAGAALVNQYNDNVLIRSFGVFPRIGSAKPGGGPSIRSAGTAALGVARLQDSPAVTALHGKGP